MEDIRLLSKDELGAKLKDMGEPRFRADQVHGWLWKKNVFSFEDMRNIPKSLIEKLNENFEIRHLKIATRQESEDGTIKLGFETFDGHMIEGVLIPSTSRLTACVSSQVGCSLTCSFCATGFLKRERNLEAAEIYDQVFMINRIAEEVFNKPLTNAVYMGMGEPLLNYKNVMESVEIIGSEDGMEFSPRRITISTAGIAKAIKKMADDGVRARLALSLHAANDIKRSEIMAINDSNNLEVLADALKYYYDKTHKRVSFEYIAFNGFNDSVLDAEELYEFCLNVPSHVNIIEYNQVEGVEFTRSKTDQLDEFVAFLGKSGS